MKRILTTILFSFLIGFTTLASSEQITDFTVNIKINKNSSLEIIEEITYDFGQVEKHGIYRDIPYKYKARGGNYNLRLSDVSVEDEFGQEYEFKVLKEGNNKRIKIGSASDYVQGIKKYIIKYKIDRAINFFEESDEFYWNVTGDEWLVPILQSRAVVALPEVINEAELKVKCFSGKVGSQSSCISHRYEYENKSQVKNISFVDDKLIPGRGFTIVVSIPKDIITKPSLVLRIFYIVKDNIILFLPFITFFIMLYLWYKRGKDPVGKGVIISQFDAPKNLTPAEVGALVDEVVHKKDISADIINLAVKGFLKIEQTEKKFSVFKTGDYKLIKLKAIDKTLAVHEKELFNAFFDKKEEVLLSDLKNNFYKKLAKVKKAVYKEAVRKELFNKNPTKIRGLYTIIGVFLLVFGWILGPFFDVLGFFAFIFSGILVIIFGFFMPKKTKKGVLAREHILGLKEYISVAEKDRLEFHNAPEKVPERFEKLLPYAIVLGVEKEWAKQFENIYDQNPSWYSDAQGVSFSAMALSKNLSSFSDSANTVLASSPNSAASGGSGFSGGSGGGFGGGGGGSW